MTAPGYGVEPWRLTETALDIDRLGRSESIFALANGHIGLRGNLDEGEPHGLPGTYLSGFYESRPLPHAEPGFGYPEASQVLVNATDGKIIRLLVDDEPFDVRYGVLRSHRRSLDFGRGTLEREVEWESPTGNVVRVASTRIVSFTQRAVAAICWEFTPLTQATRVVVQSELVANEPLAQTATLDPRDGSWIDDPLEPEDAVSSGLRAVLVHRTRRSDLRLAAGMDHVITAPGRTITDIESHPDLARVTVATQVQPGECLRLVKFLAYGWSGGRSLPAVRAQVSAALAEARQTTWDGLLEEQRRYLDRFWDGADVEVEGDAELQQALRFGMFHVLQAGARAEGRAIGAKGLTGTGYDGHAFWDTETFVLPVLTYTQPDAVAHALRWRHSTLDQARARATVLGLCGACFPWRTIAGAECSGYWPAGTAAFHVGADIADAVVRYVSATADEAFARDVGTELLVETARMWQSLGHYDAVGAFRIDGVTGPDEYSALGDNNVYTNLMARRNLQEAAIAAERYPDVASTLGVDPGEVQGWRAVAAALIVPYDERLGVHPQAEEFTEHEHWDFSGTAPEEYPLLMHFAYFDLYRKQVIKQADLVLAMHLCGDAFTPDEKLRNFSYYEALTVRDSSLSACTQAVMAAEVGHLDLAYDYAGEVALLDLHDLHHNTRDGLHIASLAGAWTVAVAGFGGMRDHGGRLSFRPRLPDALTKLSFRLSVSAGCLQVDVYPGHVTYRLRGGTTVAVTHYGDELELGSLPVTARIPPLAAPGPRPRQPAHRAPNRRAGAIPHAPRVLRPDVRHEEGLRSALKTGDSS